MTHSSTGLRDKQRIPVNLNVSHFLGVTMNALPTEYYLEVYESSFINDPSWSVESKTPFLTISIGDRFNHRISNVAWYTPPKKGQHFRVKDIEHIFWVIESAHIGHKLMVCLELVSE